MKITEELRNLQFALIVYLHYLIKTKNTVYSEANVTVLILWIKT